MARTHYPPEVRNKFLEALEKNNGLVNQTCKITGIAYATYRRWRISDPEFKQKTDEIQELVTDYVESKLFELIKNGDKIAIIFYMKCKAKDRGYVERVEMDHDFTFEIENKVIEPNKKELK